MHMYKINKINHRSLDLKNLAKEQHIKVTEGREKKDRAIKKHEIEEKETRKTSKAKKWLIFKKRL